MDSNDKSLNHTKFKPAARNVSGNEISSYQSYLDLYNKSVNNPEEFWSTMTNKFINWIKPHVQTLNWDYNKGIIQWFKGGQLNVCYNCIDRHLDLYPHKIAIIAEGNDPNDVQKLTYRQLHKEVCRFANALKKLNVKKGDRVAIYLPMIPQAAIAMLACARIGAVHSVVFAGFSSESLRSRVLDAECKIIITANEGVRGAKNFHLKKIVDEAIDGVSCVEKVIVFGRTNANVPMKNNRDITWDQAISLSDNDNCPCEVMDSEDPLFILYTSGSTGKPKGVVHANGGYITYAAVTHKYVFDLREDDIYFCAADIGWITGHSYVVYGPLCNGATTVMFESMPNYPDAGRYWDICQRLQVSIFYTAPTAIRSVAKEGEDLPSNYDLSKLRILGSVGEPINEDAWLWYYNRVGNQNCSIVDTWWQTETGGILISPLPGAIETKPGSACFPFFGIQPIVVDEKGNELSGNDVRGRLCIKFPWPGQMQTVYKDHQRFIDTYFSQFPGLYFTGDACIRDHDGYYWITGRVDDVLNVSGHRIGTAEVESALVHSGIIAEAAVVGVPHEIKGTAVYAFCILKEGYTATEENQLLAKHSVRTAIGAFAAPDFIQFVSALPRTRSGKIMRRILRKIACDEMDTIGDISTLSEPLVVQQIAEEFRLIKKSRG
jgi:acetyl-CoA synthetase